MLELNAAFFVEVSAGLNMIENMSQDFHQDPDDWREMNSKILGRLREQCVNLHLDRITRKINRLTKTIETDCKRSLDFKHDLKTHATLIHDLLVDIIDEFNSRLFLMLSEDKREWYSLEDRPIFGESVARACPRSTYQIAEAARCFALERWDACVHHLMLALEEALRKWARRLGIKWTGGGKQQRELLFSNWEDIFGAARAHINKLKSNPKTAALDAKIQKINETISHFELVRDAWRNHCQHGRDTYDERRSKNIIDHTETFMRDLFSKNRG